MARKSRKDTNIAPVIVQETIYNTAIYARLSIEDCRDKESDSIENQILIIKNYIETLPSFKHCHTYVDNGETGTDFNRPQFEQLMCDIKKGKINCVVVKDLSRFGRNYIETGEYIENIFPFMGVRFIAINDNYDSKTVTTTEGLIISLKNLINDVYAKDISQKSGSALRIKQEKGEFVGSFAPYGYKKSNEDNHKLVIDEEVAPIVRDIFRWKAEGLGNNLISRKLNEMGIPSPSKYRYNKNTYKKGEYLGSKYWQGQIIKLMTTNLIYVGHMAQGKSRKALCENKPKEMIPMSDWTVVRDTHQAIIDEDTFNKVQEIKEQARVKHFENYGKYAHLGNKTNIFKGILICKDCGSKMIRY